jgi:primosomal protein N'
MEAAAWAGPRTGGGRVLVQTRQPGHPAIQALVRWDPVGFLLGEAAERDRAGLPPGHPTFRITGTSGLEEALRVAGAETMIRSAGTRGTVCLVAVSPGVLPRFRSEVLRLAERGVVIRVEAEPTL